MTISVVICTFNGELYIEEQLQSVIHQTRPVNEILLLDDGSTDNTVEVATHLLEKAELPWKVIQNDKNMGVARNFERGIRLAVGDIVLTADQDDVWAEEKAEDFEKVFLQNPECVLSFSDAKVTDEKLQTLWESLWEAAGFGETQRNLFRENRYYEVLFSDNIVTGAAMGIRSSFARRCSPAPKGTLHDYWFALCAPAHGTIFMIEKSDLFYRQHGGNVVGIPGKGIHGKINRWIHTVKFITVDRDRRRMRAEALHQYLNTMLEECAQSRGGNELLEGCVSPDVRKEQLMELRIQVEKWMYFSVWRDTLGNRNLINDVCQIFQHAVLGDYKRYVNKTGIVMQDIASCFLYSGKGEVQ